MRMRDWSSDLCSSDLSRAMRPWKAPSWASIVAISAAVQAATCWKLVTPRPFRRPASLGPMPFSTCRLSDLAGFAVGGDREGVVGGKGVSGRVDLGGRRNIKKKTYIQSRHTDNM